MTPPYTTRSGLKIGSAYWPRQRPHHDRDALRLQEALLAGKHHKPDRSLFLDDLAVVIGMLTLFTAPFWLPHLVRLFA